MTQETIKCPKCGELIKLSEAIFHDIEIVIKAKYEKEFEKQIAEERKQLETKAKKQAEETQKVQLADLREQLKDRSARLEQAQRQELELRKQQHKLEEDKKSFELEINRKLDLERRQIAEKIVKETEESHRLKDAEKDKQLTDMRKQIDDLKRKAEQGSQQMQGEVLELEIEEILKQEFPFDNIEPVPKGVKGADAIQVVKTQSGKVCGKVLWETKRTKTWNDGWLQKLKDDQREAKADIAVLVSETLPKGLTHFRMINGVWVASISASLSLAVALRVVLIQVSREKQLQIGKKEKMELVYNYLTGTEFRNRVEAIIESFITMKKELDVEKNAMQRIWAKREKQIERVIHNIGGMHGDLEGIAGLSFPKIEKLELPKVNNEEEKDKIN